MVEKKVINGTFVIAKELFVLADEDAGNAYLASVKDFEGDKCFLSNLTPNEIKIFPTEGEKIRTTQLNDEITVFPGETKQLVKTSEFWISI